MYSISGTANKTIEKTLDDSYMEQEVKLYSDLMCIIKADGDITPVTRFVYERYYVMNQAYLSPDWKDRYFEIAKRYFEEGKKPSSFKEFIIEVGPDDQSVHFSFVSKLFHTLNEDEPIYDKYVRTFLGVGIPKGKMWEVEKILRQRYMRMR